MLAFQLQAKSIQTYKKRSTDIIDKLIQMNCKYKDKCIFGKLDLTKVKRDSSKIRWQINPKNSKATFSGSGGTRFSAVHLTNPKVILVNQKNIDLISKLRRL